MKNPIMKITMADQGIIEIELFPHLGPLAVASVMEKVKEGLYDGRRIERLEPGFVIQPVFCDEGNFANLIEPEFLTVKENHQQKFVRGTVAMAGLKDQASDSQFFITLASVERLNGNFTVIGKVTGSFEEIEKLESLEVVEQIDQESGFVFHYPKEQQILKSITLE